MDQKNFKKLLKSAKEASKMIKCAKSRHAQSQGNNPDDFRAHLRESLKEPSFKQAYSLKLTPAYR